MHAQGRAIGLAEGSRTDGQTDIRRAGIVLFLRGRFARTDGVVAIHPFRRGLIGSDETSTTRPFSAGGMVFSEKAPPSAEARDGALRAFNPCGLIALVIVTRQLPASFPPGRNFVAAMIQRALTACARAFLVFLW